MATYTADAGALLVYLVDSLPASADRVFAEAEAGETVIQTPSTALAEVLYSVSRDEDVRGIRLTKSPEETLTTLVDAGPVAVNPVSDQELAEYAEVISEFTIHDALVVASHRARETDAVITADGAIQDAGVSTIWD